jgi:hypothetical protein
MKHLDGETYTTSPLYIHFKQRTRSQFVPWPDEFAALVRDCARKSRPNNRIVLTASARMWAAYALGLRLFVFMGFGSGK